MWITLKVQRWCVNYCVLDFFPNHNISSRQRDPRMRVLLLILLCKRILLLHLRALFLWYSQTSTNNRYFSSLANSWLVCSAADFLGSLANEFGRLATPGTDPSSLWCNSKNRQLQQKEFWHYITFSQPLFIIFALIFIQVSRK